MTQGINPKQLSRGDDGYGECMGVTQTETATGTTGATKYYPFGSKTVPFAIRILDVWLVMLSAGAGSDTMDVVDVDGNSTLGGTIDVSSAGDTDVLRAVEIDNAYTDFAKGDELSISADADDDSICRVCILYVLR